MTTISKFFSGHFNIGKHVTVYGLNAMHWAVNIRTKRWGYICFRLPLPCFGKFPRLYFYVSPNATPWASTFCLGLGGKERAKAMMRRKAFGHNFDAWNNERNKQRLRIINDLL